MEVSKKRKTSLSHFEDHITCPICLEYLTIPVQQCISGHIICSSCLGRLKPGICPTCRRSLTTTVRNLFIESILKTIRLKCKFKRCSLDLPLLSMPEHILTCTYNPEIPCPLLCPDPDNGFQICKDIIDINEVKLHLETKHKKKVVNFDNKIDWGEVRKNDGLDIKVRVMKKDNMFVVIYLATIYDNVELVVIPVVRTERMKVSMKLGYEQQYYTCCRSVEGLGSPFKQAAFKISFTDVLLFGSANSFISSIDIL